MSEGYPNAPFTPDEPAAEEKRPPVHPCEACGQNESRYVVADLDEQDTSLFCPPCIVLTFAKVASEIGAG
jgi:hypothetical protein